MVYQAGDPLLKRVQASARTSEIYHEFSTEEKHRKETCTNVQSNSMVCIKLPVSTGPAWKLRPNTSHSEMIEKMLFNAQFQQLRGALPRF